MRKKPIKPLSTEAIQELRLLLDSPKRPYKSIIEWIEALDPEESASQFYIGYIKSNALPAFQAWDSQKRYVLDRGRAEAALLDSDESTIYLRNKKYPYLYRELDKIEGTSLLDIDFNYLWVDQDFSIREGVILNCEFDYARFLPQWIGPLDVENTSFDYAEILGLSPLLELEHLRGTFTQCKFSQCNFYKTILDGILLEDSIFAGCSFREADLTASSIYTCHFDGGGFLHTVLDSSRILDSGFRSVDFTEVCLTDGLVKHSRFFNSSFRNANLRKTLFEDCTFRHCDDFAGAKLEGTVFLDCDIDEETQVKLRQHGAQIS